MTLVYALVEHLPVGASGVSKQEVHGEHASIEDAVAAKQALCAERPELVGCLTVEVREQTAEPNQKQEEAGGGGAAAGGAERGGDGVRREAGGGGHAPDVPALRPAGRGVPRRAVEPALPGPGVPEAGDQPVG
jgi:hypothetical protein